MEQANTMDEEALRARFLERLRILLSDVKMWLAADPRLSIVPRQYPVDDPFGRYEAPGLEISAAGQRIASIVPLAGVVIGAEGRVDVKGPLDESAIIYLSGPGQIGATINGVSALVQDLFVGFVEPGWYWMLSTSSPNREVRRIDESVLKTMVESVSDYKIASQR